MFLWAFRKKAARLYPCRVCRDSADYFAPLQNGKKSRVHLKGELGLWAIQTLNSLSIRAADSKMIIGMASVASCWVVAMLVFE